MSYVSGISSESEGIAEILETTVRQAGKNNHVANVKTGLGKVRKGQRGHINPEPRPKDERPRASQGMMSNRHLDAHVPWPLPSSFAV